MCVALGEKAGGFFTNNSDFLVQTFNIVHIGREAGATDFEITIVFFPYTETRQMWWLLLCLVTIAEVAGVVCSSPLQSELSSHRH